MIADTGWRGKASGNSVASGKVILSSIRNLATQELEEASQ